VSVQIALPPEPPPAEILEGLQSLRRLRRQYRLASLAFLPAIMALGMASLALFRWKPLGTAATLVGGFAYMTWLNRVELRVIVARCPRCAAAFHGPSPWGLGSGLPRHFYPRRCQTCGLALSGENINEHDA
jgi:hypothetical protein